MALQPSPVVARALERAGAATGLDPRLLTAVAYVETRYNPDSVSSVGAQGLMQLMPGTAQALGVANPFDPYENALGGAQFLAQLLRKYGGDLRKALAAYNWGPGHVDRTAPADWPASVKRYVDNVVTRLPPELRPWPARWPLFASALALGAGLWWFWRKRLE